MSWDAVQWILGIVLFVVFLLVMMRGCCGIGGRCGMGSRRNARSANEAQATERDHPQRHEGHS